MTRDPIDPVVFFLALLAFTAFASLLGAVALKMAARMVKGLPIPYGDAYVSTFFSFLITSSVLHVVRSAVPTRGPAAVPSEVLLVLGGTFAGIVVIQAVILCVRHELKPVEGLLASFLMSVLYAVMAFGLARGLTGMLAVLIHSLRGVPGGYR